MKGIENQGVIGRVDRSRVSEKSSDRGLQNKKEASSMWYKRKENKRKK